MVFFQQIHTAFTPLTQNIRKMFCVRLLSVNIHKLAMDSSIRTTAALGAMESTSA